MKDLMNFIKIRTVYYDKMAGMLCNHNSPVFVNPKDIQAVYAPDDLITVSGEPAVVFTIQTSFERFQGCSKQLETLFWTKEG